VAARSGPLAELLEAGAAVGGVLAGILATRLELAGVEAREAAVRLAQLCILACLGCGLLLLGLGLALLAAVLVTPPPYRALAAACGAALALGAGAIFLCGVRRRLVRAPRLFSESVRELRKDRECF
jgi:uncharacterized membrane protein YqjE